MMTIELNGVNGLELNYANALTSGYGHKKVTVELYYNGEFKEFSATTNNMPGYDEAMDMEDYYEKQLALYELIDHTIEDEVMEWIDQVDNTEE